MRAGGGHDKGAGFERDMCRFLSNWISGGQRDDIFWRSAGSGGLATQAAKKGKIKEFSSSDIAPTHKLAYDLLEIFTIECKFYADMHLQDLPYDRVSNIATFWKQAKSDAQRVNKEPLMLAKQNRRPILVGLTIRGFDALNSTVVRRFNFVVSSRHNLVLVEMDSVFGSLRPHHLPTLLEKLTCSTPASS